MPKKTGPTAVVRDGYHHGALREALIEASESLLAERGLEGFSLREVARRSGVSPAAPAHHFGDAAGLLTVVATLAFDGLTAALEAGNARGGDDPDRRLVEQGVGYVAFALRHPGRFGLMFSGKLHEDEALKRSGTAAFDVLESGIRALLDIPPSKALSRKQSHAVLATWAIVHGFATLALTGQFDRLGPAGGRDAMPRRMVAPIVAFHLAGLRAEFRPAAPRGR